MLNCRVHPTTAQMLKKSLILLLAAIAGTGAWVYWYISQFASEPGDPVASDLTPRTLDSGPVIGFEDRGSLAWTGIPYAAAPVGDLRWRAPRPMAAWQAPREMLTFGASCVQVRLGDAAGLRGEEDCLYLNVWAPADGGPAPVMFFIHGGANHVGESLLFKNAIRDFLGLRNRRKLHVP